jgi:hypothetical protein
MLEAVENSNSKVHLTWQLTVFNGVCRWYVHFEGEIFCWKRTLKKDKVKYGLVNYFFGLDFNTGLMIVHSEWVCVYACFESAITTKSGNGYRRMA